jgi:LCP family protein required for cell wall assembly
MRKISLNQQAEEANKVSSVEPAQMPDTEPSLSKRRNLQPEKPKKKFVFNFKLLAIGIAAVCLISALAYFATTWNRNLENSVDSEGNKQADACTDILNPKCWTAAVRPQLKKENDKTNALLVGIDTRAEGSGSGLMNTDTLMLVTLDHKTNMVRLLSFPRDLYAPYGCPGSSLPNKIKINAIYAYGKFSCPQKDGMAALKQTIEKISGEKIQYTALVRLEGVVNGIDKIGGIDVDVPEKVVDVYPYIELTPDRQKTCNHATNIKNVGYPYCIFTFEAGKTHMSGDDALIYARMRKLSDDYHRARRQQQIVDAVKDKILSDNTPMLEKANNLLTLYSEISKYVDADVDLQTLLAGLDLANKVDRNPINVVLDPNFGGGGLIFGGAKNYAFSDYTFKPIQAKLAFIDQNAKLYDEKAEIYAVNYSGVNWTNDSPPMVLKGKDYWWTKQSGSEIITDSKPKQTNDNQIVIVDFSGGKKPGTIAWLKQKYEEKGFTVKVDANVVPTATPTDTATGTPTAAKPTYTQSKYKEDVAVYVYTMTAATTTTTPTANPGN